jgi:hypothetical protein
MSKRYILVELDGTDESADNVREWLSHYYQNVRTADVTRQTRPYESRPNDVVVDHVVELS